MHKRIVCSIAALASAGLAASARADSQANSQIYGSLGYTQTQLNGAQLGSVDARVGDKFTPYLGAEGELSVGVNSDAAANLGPEVTQRINTAVAGYGVGFLPLGNRVSLLARLGVGETQFGVNNAGAASHLNLASINYGAGAMLNVSPSNSVRVDYTRKTYDQSGLNANTWGVSLLHHF